MTECIVGIDEVGRGCLAGPLVVGAVLLGDTWIEGLMDSKLLSRERREQLAPIITEHAAAVGLGWVTPAEIDSLGLTRSQQLGAKRALQAIGADYDNIILDGSHNFLGRLFIHNGTKHKVFAIPKADQTERAVSAASIIAKVARDNYMIELARDYPGYGFETHVGYGTREHLKALNDPSLGVVVGLHRSKFGPVAERLALAA